MNYNSKQVIKKKLSGAIVEIYNSIGEACRKNKIAEHYMRSNISNGKLFFNGYVFEKVK